MVVQNESGYQVNAKYLPHWPMIVKAKVVLKHTSIPNPWVHPESSNSTLGRSRIATVIWNIVTFELMTDSDVWYASRTKLLRGVKIIINVFCIRHPRNRQSKLTQRHDY